MRTTGGFGRYAGVLCWLGLAGLCAALQAGGGPAVWALERPLAPGRCWQLVTASFVHLSWTHWALNMGAAALLLALFARSGRRAVLGGSAVLGACALLVMTGEAWAGSLPRSCGLSGALHGVAVVGAGRSLPGRWRGIALAAIAIKVGFEQAFGAGMTGDLIGGVVATEHHLYGVLAGAAILVLMAVRGHVGGRGVDAPSAEVSPHRRGL